MTAGLNNDPDLAVKDDSERRRNSRSPFRELYNASSGELEELDQFIKDVDTQHGVVLNYTHTEEPSAERAFLYRPGQGTETFTDADAGNKRLDGITVAQYAEGRSLQELDLLGIGSGHKDLNGSYKAART